MYICNNIVGNIYFGSNNSVSSKNNSCDSNSQECSVNEHCPENESNYYSIYEKQGKMSDCQFSSFVNNFVNISKPSDENDVLSLPLENVKKIGKNSYRGQTLCFTKNRNIECIKNAGVNTVIDLVGYFDYDTKVKNNGLNYHLFKIDEFLSSAACESLKDYLNKNKLFLIIAKNEGIDIDIDEHIMRDKALFLKKTRGDINRFVDFINVMRGDNVYIGCERGTRETDEALIFNEVFNPIFQNQPLDFDKISQSAIKPDYKSLFPKIYNLYYNLSSDDKANIGWTYETDIKFIERMTDYQLRLLSSNH